MWCRANEQLGTYPGQSNRPKVTAPFRVGTEARGELCDWCRTPQHTSPLQAARFCTTCNPDDRTGFFRGLRNTTRHPLVVVGTTESGTHRFHTKIERKHQNKRKKESITVCWQHTLVSLLTFFWFCEGPHWLVCTQYTNQEAFDSPLHCESLFPTSTKSS